MGTRAYESLAGKGSRPPRAGDVDLSSDGLPADGKPGGGRVTDLRLFAIAFAVALVIVVLATVALHENHYKDRRWRILEGRLATLETIIQEDRRT